MQAAAAAGARARNAQLELAIDELELLAYERSVKFKCDYM